MHRFAVDGYQLRRVDAQSCLCHTKRNGWVASAAPCNKDNHHVNKKKLHIALCKHRLLKWPMSHVRIETFWASRCRDTRKLCWGLARHGQRDRKDSICQRSWIYLYIYLNVWRCPVKALIWKFPTWNQLRQAVLLFINFLRGSPDCGSTWFGKV